MLVYVLEVEDLIEVGRDEIERKKQRLSIDVTSKVEPSSNSSQSPIQAPILPSTLVEDESHFLLSRTILPEKVLTPETVKSEGGEEAQRTQIDHKLPKNSTVEKENELLMLSLRQNA